MTSQAAPIQLREYEATYLPAAALTPDQGRRLWQSYGRQVDVAFPSPQTDERWRLTPQGWVGWLALDETCRLLLRPKVPLPHLLGMLAYVHDLPLEAAGSAHFDSLPAFYDYLANRLAAGCLRRLRQGLSQSYRPRQGRQPALRGRVDWPQAARTPAAVPLPTRDHLLTADIPANQVLAYTVDAVARARLCRPDTQAQLRRARRGLLAAAAPQPWSPADFQAQTYDRLDEDYRPLHALCRFLLSHTGPTPAAGAAVAPPFLIDMNRLFEQFVAGWLAAHLPPRWRLRAQERVYLDAAGRHQFAIDLVLYDRPANRAVAVLDTKYKAAPGAVAAADIAQVAAYAAAVNAPLAGLIYPAPPPAAGAIKVGPTPVRALTFDLAQDLDTAGAAFLGDLLPLVA